MTRDEEIQNFGRSIQGPAQRIESFADLDDQRLSYWKDVGIWWLYLPGCGVGNLSSQQVTEHPNGTITVSPSILVTGHNKGQKVTRHGYLENSVWREV